MPEQATTRSEQLREQYRHMTRMAEHIQQARTRRARAIAAAAGLDSSAPFHMAHNAWCALQSGQPWPSVDQSAVRLLKRWDREGYVWQGYRIRDRWVLRTNPLAPDAS